MTFPTAPGNVEMDASFGSQFEDDENDPTTRSEGALGTKQLQSEQRKTLARKESRAVWMVRGLVYLVVLVTAVLVSLGVYALAHNNQKDDFEKEFASFASKLTESFYSSLEAKIGAFNTMSTSITSYALDNALAFPNITIPHFEMQGANLRIESQVMQIYWNPVVTDETRQGWEAYAAAHRGHNMESFAVEEAMKLAQDEKFGFTKEPGHRETRHLQDQEEDTDYLQSGLNQTIFEDGYHYHIWAQDDTELGIKTMPLGSGPFFPIWQLTPVIPFVPVLNGDLGDHKDVGAPMHASYNSGQIVMGPTFDLRDPSESKYDEEYFNVFLLAGQWRNDYLANVGDPTSCIVYPVFDQFGPNRTVAGLLYSTVYWRINFINVLPEAAKGITVVLDNNLNQSFTYRIDGPQVTFLGPGDRHDPNYETKMVKKDVVKNLQERASPANQAFDAADYNDEYCSYTLRVYPSQDTESYYVNNEPALYALVVAAVFAFTSVVFITYDLLVARRQQIVMQRAVESGALVASLYPKQVRDRLFQEDNNKANDKNVWRTSVAMEEQAAASNDASRPIADYYEHTTIMFADLSGFTKWSSSRSPEEVFVLLESLYQAFDKIAVRRKVFKVETIGDCYVAVTGLPDPQPDHAVIMTKFARDCNSKMAQLLPSLAGKLGEDTLGLLFRVGLHSGPVTGGVLRGQKSRFQLFGDTINTASRMESNGVAGRIHVSEDTANELRKHKCGHWLLEREDKITAKGKGEMTTFFVTMNEARSITASSVVTQSVLGEMPQYTADLSPGSENNNQDEAKDYSQHAEV